MSQQVVIVKLISGEEVLCALGETLHEHALTLINPFSLVNDEQGNFVGVPYSPLSKFDDLNMRTFNINKAHVMLVTQPIDSATEMYENLFKKLESDASQQQEESLIHVPESGIIMPPTASKQMKQDVKLEVVK